MKRKVSVGLSMLLIVLLSGGCQSSSLTVPELISERESSKKTCVAEYHDIYDVKVEDAWVNGVRECVIAKTDGVVKELHKIVGDRVKKGDVLLTTASEELETRYESLQEEISEIDQNHASQLKVYQLERQKRTAQLSYLKSEAGRDASGEADAKEQSRLIKLCQAEITEIDHNIAYENRMHEAKVKVQREQLLELKKQLEQNVLKSPCDGIVGEFLRGITVGSSITAKQPAVVIYNTDCKVLNYDSDVQYAMDDESSKIVAEDIVFYYQDKKYNLEEYTYNERQKRAGVSMETSLQTCYIFDGIKSMEIGDMGKIVYKINVKEHALVVPNDAVKSEGQQKFVYVKGEKVYVETGVISSRYTEIVTGLSEGDEVSYISYEGMTANETLDVKQYEGTGEGPLPKVTEAKVERGDIAYAPNMDLSEDDDGFEPYFEYQVVDTYESGVFEKLLVSTGDKVKKGQAVAYVRHDVKKSELVSLQNEIAENRRQLQRERLSYDKQVKEYKKQLIKADNSYERSQVNYDLEILKTQYLLTVQTLNQGIRGCQKELSDLQEKSSGIVKAPASGTVVDTSVFTKGQSISPADFLCKIAGDDYYLCRVHVWGQLHVNQRVTLTMMKDDSKVSGTVIYDGSDVYRGGTNDLLLREEVQKNECCAYIKTDQKLDYKLLVKGATCNIIQLKNVLSLPDDAVEFRTSLYDGYHNCFVNKKIGEDDYIKTNVITGGGYNASWIIEGMSEGDTVGYLEWPDVE